MLLRAVHGNGLHVGTPGHWVGGRVHLAPLNSWKCIHVSINSIVLIVLEWSAEVLLKKQVGTYGNSCETRICHRAFEDLRLHFIHSVVGDQVMRNSIQADTHRLLDQTVFAESIRIDKRADQLSFNLLVRSAVYLAGRFLFEWC